MANKRKPRRRQSGIAGIVVLVLIILLLLAAIAVIYMKYGRPQPLPTTTAATVMTSAATTTVETTTTTTTLTTTAPPPATEPLAGRWMGYLSIDMADGTEYELEAEIMLEAQSDSELAMVLTPTGFFENGREGDLARFSAVQSTVQWDGANLVLQYDPLGSGQAMIFTLPVEDRPYGKLAESDAINANGDESRARLSMTRK